jgi:signal transduction histidine kinase
VLEARRERIKVLLLFGVATLPPLILLGYLAWAAARNETVALRHVEQELARQSAAQAKRELEDAIGRAEDEVFRSLDLGLLRERRDPDELQATLAACREQHPVVLRFFALTERGEVVWPHPQTLPFREPGRVSEPVEESTDVSQEDRDQARLLRESFQRAKELEREGELRQAAALYARVGSATPRQVTTTLAARACFRLGACLERLADLGAARNAYRAALDMPDPARDDQGVLALRVQAGLRRLELLSDAKEPSTLEEARSLGHDLIEGRYRADLFEHEWLEATARVQAILSQSGAEGARAAADQERAAAAVAARREWYTTVRQDLAPLLLPDAALAAEGETRHFSQIDDPPVVICFRVLPAIPGASLVSGVAPALDLWSGTLLVGLQLDVARLARDVLGPACGKLHVEEGVPVAVLDARREVMAYAGREARPDADTGRVLESELPSATVPLDPVPLWSVRVVRPEGGSAEATQDRLALYGSLVLLTLLLAGLGARATVRYVQRSLELAKLKQDFISNVTHELKTPLTSIKMYGEMLAKGRLRTAEKRLEYAQHIVRESDRLYRLIEDILDFARQDSGAVEQTYVLAEEDVADTVREALDLFRASARVRGFDLFVELPPVGQLPPVDLDRDAIVRAVLNLLSNAVKYSADQRYLKVAVKREDTANITVDVSDRGIGIDPEDLDRIFDRFFRAGDPLTRGVSGTGLGLALVDQIVQAHQGEIRVSSHKGQGSTFTVVLPIVADYREQWPPPQDTDLGRSSDQADTDESLEPARDTV